MPSRAKFLAKWSPRIGRNAARLHVLSQRATTAGIWSTPVWLSLCLVGQHLASLCAYAVAVIGFGCLALGTLSMHRMFQALSRRFGFKVTWRSAPPYRLEAFTAWCNANGLDPTTGRPRRLQQPLDTESSETHSGTVLVQRNHSQPPGRR
jgi:hypothetical protein